MTSNPYPAYRIAIKYLWYWITSKGRHSVHSPLIFQFVEAVLKKRKLPNFLDVEQNRTHYKNSKDVIEFTDYGKNGKILAKKVSDIAKKSLKSQKYAKLLSRSIEYFKAKSILELGTSLGITTSYIAKSTVGRVITLEGDKTVSALAKIGWDRLQLDNITNIIGDFGDTLPPILNQNQFDLIYLDGNHRLKPTLAYFESILANCNNPCVLIFDDIHYSDEMEKAWEEIKRNPSVQSTIDLFFLGYVLINYDITPKHYVLRF